MTHLSAAFAAVLLAGSLVSATSAQTFDSAYTDLDLKKCKHTDSKEPEDYGFWTCRGHAGVTVRVSGADQRTTVSFGPKAADQLAASQTFPSFNSVDKVKVEWRLVKEGQQKSTPFATIVRWQVKLDEDTKASRGRVLAVTRLGDTVCHVGYVDALANKNANALARELAEKHARTFDCEKDKRIILGVKGDSIAGMAEQIESEEEEKKNPPPAEKQ